MAEVSFRVGISSIDGYVDRMISRNKLILGFESSRVSVVLHSVAAIWENLSDHRFPITSPRIDRLGSTLSVISDSFSGHYGHNLDFEHAFDLPFGSLSCLVLLSIVRPVMLPLQLLPLSPTCSAHPHLFTEDERFWPASQMPLRTFFLRWR